MILSPQLIKPHFKTDIYRGILAYLEKNYPALDIDQLCLDAGLPRSFLTTPGNWVSIKFAYEFTRLCKERTDNPRISFEAGRQQMSPTTIGETLWNYFSGQIPVRMLYRILPSLTSQFSKVTRVEILKLESHYAEFELSLRKESFDSEWEWDYAKRHAIEIYESTMGYYTAVPTLHNLPLAVANSRIEQTSDHELPRFWLRIDYADIGWKFPMMTTFVVSLTTWLGYLTSEVFSAPTVLMAMLGSAIGFAISLFIRLRATTKALVKGSEAMVHHAKQYNLVYKQKAASDRFVPHELLNLLKREDLEDVKIGDMVESNLTVLFCDINDFSPLSEELGPHKTLELLNQVFAAVCPAIRKAQGREISFIFDEVVAIFQRSPEDAIIAGCSILAELDRFNAHRIISGQKPIGVKIGINTGAMSVGVNGYQDYMTLSFASIEGSVGKRLQQLAKQLGVPMLVGQATIEKASPNLKHAFRRIGSIPLKGVSQKNNVYQVLPSLEGKDLNPFLASRDVFERAVDCFGERDWEESLRLFHEVLKVYPTDSVSQIHVLRCLNNISEAKQQHDLTSQRNLRPGK